MTVNKKISLSKYFLLITSGFSVLTVVIFFYISQKIYSEISFVTLREESVKIERSFLDAIDYSSYLMRYLGLQIVENRRSKDLHYISKLFSSFKPQLDRNIIIPWNMFSWVDVNFNLVANSSFGIVKPISVRDRSYAKMSVAKPWEIHMDKVSYGKVSKELIIPSGMGIADARGKYIGAIVFGFNIEKMIRKMSESTDLTKVSFAIFDKEAGVFVGSSKDFTASESFLSEIKSTTSKSKADKVGNFLFFSDNENYGLFKKVSDYPYFIVVKYNKNFAKREILLKALPYLIELLVIFFIVSILFYILKILVINPILQLSIASKLIAQDRDSEAKFPQTKVVEIDNLAKQIFTIGNYKFDLLQTKKSQERFFANMNHELRTPLNGILNFSLMMKNGMFGPISDEYKEMATDINSSGHHLLNLINDILDFAKMDLGKVKIYEEEFEILQEVNEAIKIVASDILLNNNSAVKILSSIDPTINKIRADRRMFKQILLNLLSNAMKFTSEGEINLCIIKNRDGGINIEVSDSGIGIKEEDLKKLAVEFGQVGDGFSRGNKQGSGLGLFLVKKMVGLHNGSFKINSVYGKGTTITIKFPKSRVIL